MGDNVNYLKETCINSKKKQLQQTPVNICTG
jgi:hypothetical protein